MPPPTENRAEWIRVVVCASPYPRPPATVPTQRLTPIALTATRQLGLFGSGACFSQLSQMKIRRGTVARAVMMNPKRRGALMCYRLELLAGSAGNKGSVSRLGEGSVSRFGTGGAVVDVSRSGGACGGTGGTMIRRGRGGGGTRVGRRSIESTSRCRRMESPRFSPSVSSSDMSAESGSLPFRRCLWARGW